ncbi:MAG: glycosyl hydrolase [Verrucomicrobia bacterium]|nr:glycosyl hydrolase [Verrucomicrobiota bacterium]
MRKQTTIAMLVVCALTGIASVADDLAKNFAAPPPSARPWVYYFIMDGNFTRAGITSDFEAMKRAGIGGMLIMEVNVGIPQGPVKFMSAEWRQLFKHAVRETERLGLQITLNAGPGWTGSGGPWVKPEQSMQHVVASAVEVSGPAKFDATLPRPTPRPAYFGNKGLPEEILKAKDEFYVDVAVMAVPKTDDAQRIADIDEKALYLRHPYTSRPGTKPFLSAPADFPALPGIAVIPADRVVDLTARLAVDGHLAWDVPAGKWTILRFGRTSTGANTRPAPAPGLGLECDKFDKAALDAHFEKFIGALVRETGPRGKSPDKGWTSLHIDSWEMGAQNWSAAFREEFRKRRGYDPLRYLPAVTGRVVESLEVSERFLWDLRQTAQELVIENHAQHLKKLGLRHGLGLSIEPYDMNPCADLSLGAVADVPMCEFWLYGFNSFFSCIEAASVAHTCGRPVVAAEAFTSSAAERWQAHPASMKPLGDWAFCAGINRIVFHRYQHQPWLDRRPGMTMGPYGVHWERTQTWWEMVPAYHTYLARCQFMLRQGLPVADVLYLAVEGAPHVFRAPTSATRGNPPDRFGYNFDGIAPETLLARVSVKDGKLVLPDGMSYRVLVLPERDTMTPVLLRKVKELVEVGAMVIGPRPLKSPSLSGYPKCDDEVRSIAGELWGDCDGRTIKEHRVGKGRIVCEPRRQADTSQETKNPLEHAKWIWHKEAKPGMNAPVGRRVFRRTVMLETTAQIESARVFMTADNSFELTVNGRNAGSGDNFHDLRELDVAQMLKPGANELVVIAENGGDAPNPAGLIGALVIKFRDGRVLELPTNRQWQSALTAEAGVWSPTLELGPVGMTPWKLNGKPTPPEPEQYGDFAVVTDVLKKMSVAPDFESDASLRYTHRRDDETDIYFVANPEDRDVKAVCAFRVSGGQPELWDSVTGATRRLGGAREQDGRTIVSLEFAPRQSWFVVFRNSGRLAPRDAETANALSRSERTTLSGPWEVSFDPKWGGPARVTFETLKDWTKYLEPGIRYYSGKAIYRTTFDAPRPALHAPRLFLDLGKVAVMASVRLNGRDLGVVWCAPWRVEISGVVKERENRLEITVANLWPNRLIGDQSLPLEKRFTWTTWNPFKKDDSLIESGLLGPVTIQSAERIAP